MKKTVSIILSLIMLMSAAAVPHTVYAADYKSKNGEFKITTSDMSRPSKLNKGEGFILGGKLRANKRIDVLKIRVLDLNQFKYNISVTKYPKKKTVKLKDYAQFVKFRALSSGDKRLIITAVDKDKNEINIKRDFTVLGKAKEPVHITKKCKITVSRGNKNNALDTNDDTYWSHGKMTITLPKNKTADGLYIKWHVLDNEVTIRSYGKKNKLLDSYDGYSDKMLNKYYPLDKNAVKVVIRLKKLKDNKGIARIRVYEKDRVGVSVQRWEKLRDGEADLMVVSAHRDDELLYFGGTIPYYAGVKHKKVYVVYMSGDDRLRHREALEGQWAIGNKYYPMFMNFAGGYHDGISGTLKSWGGESYVLSRVVEKIRRYKPDVIVTHDERGEYGHPSHKTVSYVVKKAVKIAGDKSKFPASAKQYGAWKVKKLYIHMYPKNKLVMKYKSTYDELGGRTPYALACIGYDKHYSQHGRWSMTASYVTKYPSSNYGLAYTRVGLDKKKNDMFEHID